MFEKNPVPISAIIVDNGICVCGAHRASNRGVTPLPSFLPYQIHPAYNIFNFKSPMTKSSKIVETKCPSVSVKSAFLRYPQGRCPTFIVSTWKKRDYRLEEQSDSLTVKRWFFNQFFFWGGEGASLNLLEPSQVVHPRRKRRNSRGWLLLN